MGILGSGSGVRTGSGGGTTPLFVFVILFIAASLTLELHLTTAARQQSSRRSNRAGRGRVVSQPLIITDDSRRYNRLEEPDAPDFVVPAESTLPPANLLAVNQWLEFESVPKAKTSAKLHSEVILECVVLGSPPPTIYWLKNDRPIETVPTFDSKELLNSVDPRNPLLQSLNNNVVTNNNNNNNYGGQGQAAQFSMSKVHSKLPLRCIRPEDEGKYTCVASNDGRELASSTVVVIEEDDRSLDWKPECEFRLPPQEFIGKKARRGTPAYIHLSETIHMEAIGTDIVLPCRGGGIPQPTLVWTNTEGQRLTYGKKFRMNSRGDLVVKNLSWNEMGEYTCTAENLYGSESSATFLYPLLPEKN